MELEKKEVLPPTFAGVRLLADNLLWQSPSIPPRCRTRCKMENGRCSGLFLASYWDFLPRRGEPPLKTPFALPSVTMVFVNGRQRKSRMRTQDPFVDLIHIGMPHLIDSRQNGHALKCRFEPMLFQRLGVVLHRDYPSSCASWTLKRPLLFGPTSKIGTRSGSLQLCRCRVTLCWFSDNLTGQNIPCLDGS